MIIEPTIQYKEKMKSKKYNCTYTGTKHTVGRVVVISWLSATTFKILVETMIMWRLMWLIKPSRNLQVTPHLSHVSFFFTFWMLTFIQSRSSSDSHTEAGIDIRKDVILADSLISMMSFVGNNGCFWNANTATFIGRKRFRYFLLRSYIYLPARFSSAFSNFIATVAISFFHSALFDERSPHVLLSI